MQRQSPPKHRHDGTSPLPLGMDWSPPPRKWNGRDTVWPHDPRSGWSYCVIVPSWIMRPKTRDSDSVVFYRVQVGIQSPEGVTTTRGVLRRFNDFLKLFALLKKAFPKRTVPPAPPKGLLKLKTRVLLEERRSSLEAWMMKLLTDIEFSRSAPVASFLELEVAVRSSFQSENQQHTETSHLSGTSSSLQVFPNLNPTASAGPSSQASDYGSDTAYETSGIESPILERDNNSEIGMDELDEDLGNPIEKFVKYGMSNIDEGLFMGNSILEQIEGFPKHKSHYREINSVVGNVTNNGLEPSGIDPGKRIDHSRNLSIESAGSYVSSPKSSELSNSSFQNSTGDGHLFNSFAPEIPRIKGSQNHGHDIYESNSVDLLLPIDQRQKMNRILVGLQRRLLTAKTDMEDLITRLNQEIAVKDYLDTKVKDLEIELETTRQKSKESLQQAILVERERVTQMQWDMEELRQKSFELELKLKPQQGDGLDTESNNGSALLQDMETTFFAQDKDDVLQELENTKKQLQDLLKKHEDLQVKSKADIKVLVREVKSLRSSQIELKQEVNQSLKEKSSAQDLLRLEKERKMQTNIDRKKLLNECSDLHKRLMECTRHIMPEYGVKLSMDSSCITDALDLLESSDNQISCLLEELESLTQNDEVKGDTMDDETIAIDDDLKKMLTNLLIENAKLRKETNSALRSTFQRDSISVNKSHGKSDVK